MSHSTLIEQRLECWLLARRVAQHVISDDVDADATKLVRWCQSQKNDQLGFKALMAAAEGRTGGASIGQILTAAGAAYTFAVQNEVAAAPKPPPTPPGSSPSPTKKSPRKKSGARRSPTSDR